MECACVAMWHGTARNRQLWSYPSIQSSTGSGIHVATLHLRHVDGAVAPVTLTAIALNLTAWSAKFAVPHTIAPGRYTASVSNGHGPPVPVDCFVSPSLPSVRWVDIAAKDPDWPPSSHFNVTAFGKTEPIVGRDPPGGVTDGSSRPPLPFVMPVNSTPPLLVALAAAQQAGGGTVLLPGYYYSTPLHPTLCLSW